MAPQFSTLSVQKYIDAATAALPAGMRVRGGPIVPRASAARSTRSPNACARRAPAATSASMFTAHALPRARHRRAATSTPTKWRRPRAASRRAPASPTTSCAYQSAGPDAGAVDRPGARRGDRRRGGGRRRASSSSCRSASSAITRRSCSTSTCRRRRSRASSRAALRRTESLNTSPTFIAMLEDLVRDALCMSSALRLRAGAIRLALIDVWSRCRADRPRPTSMS